MTISSAADRNVTRQRLGIRGDLHRALGGDVTGLPSSLQSSATSGPPPPPTSTLGELLANAATSAQHRFRDREARCSATSRPAPSPATLNGNATNVTGVVARPRRHGPDDDGGRLQRPVAHDDDGRYRVRGLQRDRGAPWRGNVSGHAEVPELGGHGRRARRPRPGACSPRGTSRTSRKARSPISSATFAAKVPTSRLVSTGSGLTAAARSPPTDAVRACGRHHGLDDCFGSDGD